jgi:hypothetical protein
MAAGRRLLFASRQEPIDRFAELAADSPAARDNGPASILSRVMLSSFRGTSSAARLLQAMDASLQLPHKIVPVSTQNDVFGDLCGGGRVPDPARRVGSIVA